MRCPHCDTEFDADKGADEVTCPRFDTQLGRTADGSWYAIDQPD